MNLSLTELEYELNEKFTVLKEKPAELSQFLVSWIDRLKLKIEKEFDPYSARHEIGKLGGAIKYFSNNPSVIGDGDLAQFSSILNELKSKAVKLFGQRSFMAKMEIMGYQLGFKGLCGGLSHTSMHYFLAGEINEFNNLCDLVYDGNARSSQEKIKVFFDSIALYQTPYKFKNFFPRDEIIRTQSGVAVLPFVHPIKGLPKKQEPVLLNSFPGAYNKHDLELYLSLLKCYLGQYSFSLILSSNSHSINLNFDPVTQSWLLLNPTKLPGDNYIHESLLSEALFKNFMIENNFMIMNTNIFVAKGAQKNMKLYFSNLEQDSQWSQLYSADKINLVSTNNRSQLWYAVANQNTSWIKKSLNNGLDVNQKMEDGITALMKASLLNSTEIMNILIDAGAVIDEQNDFGFTALMIAAQHESLDAMQLLVNKGANINTQNLKGDTVLMLSAYAGYLDGVNYLLSVKCVQQLLSFNQEDPEFIYNAKEYHLALSYACLKGHEEIARLLIDMGVGANAPMLEIACRNGHTAVVELFLSRGAQADKEMLNAACKNGHTEIVRLLLANSIIPDEKTFALTTINKSEILALLHEANPNVAYQHETGRISLVHSGSQQRNLNLFWPRPELEPVMDQYRKRVRFG